jgi:hypothetical protein
LTPVIGTDKHQFGGIAEVLRSIGQLQRFFGKRQVLPHCALAAPPAGTFYNSPLPFKSPACKVAAWSNSPHPYGSQKPGAIRVGKDGERLSKPFNCLESFRPAVHRVGFLE